MTNGLLTLYVRVKMAQIQKQFSFSIIIPCAIFRKYLITTSNQKGLISCEHIVRANPFPCCYWFVTLDSEHWGRRVMDELSLPWGGGGLNSIYYMLLDNDFHIESLEWLSYDQRVFWILNILVKIWLQFLRIDSKTKVLISSRNCKLLKAF